MQEKLIDTPKIVKNIQVIIDNCDYFPSNSILVKKKWPVVDAIGRLERAKTSVGDNWKEFGTVYQQILKIDLTSYTRFHHFEDHCLKVLHDPAQNFNHQIYIVGFFLDPNFHQVAVSKAYLIKEITKMILLLAKAWDYKKVDAIDLWEKVTHYFSGGGAFWVSSNCTSLYIVFIDQVYGSSSIDSHLCLAVSDLMD